MYFELLSREEFEKIYPDLPRENIMSPEKLFIRDLINLCEQYGMVVNYNVCTAGNLSDAFIAHKNENEYKEIMRLIEGLE